MYHIPKYTRAFLLFFREKSHSTTVTHLYTFFFLSFRTYVHVFLHHICQAKTVIHTHSNVHAYAYVYVDTYIRTYIHTYMEYGTRMSDNVPGSLISEHIWTYSLGYTFERTCKRTFIRANVTYADSHDRDSLLSELGHSDTYSNVHANVRSYVEWYICRQPQPWLPSIWTGSLGYTRHSFVAEWARLPSVLPWCREGILRVCWGECILCVLQD